MWALEAGAHVLLRGSGGALVRVTEPEHAPVGLPAHLATKETKGHQPQGFQGIFLYFIFRLSIFFFSK